MKRILKSLNNGTLSSAIITIVGAFIFSNIILGSYQPFIAILVGIVVGLVIAKITEVYTLLIINTQKRTQESETGASANV